MELGFTQVKFAKMINVTGAMLCMMESGKRSISYGVLLKLQHLFYDINYCRIDMVKLRTKLVRYVSRLKDCDIDKVTKYIENYCSLKKG